MQAIEDKVINRIYGKGRGWAFFKNDFVDLGSADAIDKALSQKELDSKEKYWIKFYDSNNKHVGYNNKKGGANGKHLPEARKKISEAGRRPCSQETKDKISKANKGQVPWAKGRRFTKEHRLKIAINPFL